MLCCNVDMKQMHVCVSGIQSARHTPSRPNRANSILHNRQPWTYGDVAKLLHNITYWFEHRWRSDSRTSSAWKGSNQAFQLPRRVLNITRLLNNLWGEVTLKYSPAKLLKRVMSHLTPLIAYIET